MTENEELLEAIRKYQSCPYVHELTCGNDSSHSSLIGVVIQDTVMLQCPDCDYLQGHVPGVVWSTVDIEIAMKKLLGV